MCKTPCLLFQYSFISVSHYNPKAHYCFRNGAQAFIFISHAWMERSITEKENNSSEFRTVNV